MPNESFGIRDTSSKRLSIYSVSCRFPQVRVRKCSEDVYPGLNLKSASASPCDEVMDTPFSGG